MEKQHTVVDTPDACRVSVPNAFDDVKADRYWASPGDTCGPLVFAPCNHHNTSHPQSEFLSSYC
jgi:hypothetical protein